MAKEYIKKDDNLIPIADTQGLLIPASARGCIGKFTGPLTIASGSANITYSYDSGENWIVDGGIKAPKTGMYIVSEALNTEGSGTERVTACRILKNNSQVGQSYQLTANQAGDWSSYCNSTQIYCNEGDILKFNVNMYTGTNLVVNNSWLCVTLVEQIVPDIIANKGALVSNPAPGGVSLDAETGKLWANTKPDYSNQRATPVINFSGTGEVNQTWVVDENGWVRFTTQATNATGTISWLAQMVTVNGKTVHYFMSFPSQAGWNVPMFGLVPVSKGNTLALYHNSGGFDSVVSTAFIIPDRIYAP
jgi:hypothetical protein